MLEWLGHGIYLLRLLFYPQTPEVVKVVNSEITSYLFQLYKLLKMRKLVFGPQGIFRSAVVAWSVLNGVWSAEVVICSNFNDGCCANSVTG